MIIALDFDGTVVAHDFPNVGIEIGATPVLKRLVEKGHDIILWSMRSNVTDPESYSDEIHTQSGDFLSEAINWFKERDIPLYGINQNPDQMTWTASPKVYAHLYIDDKSLGTPTVTKKIGKRTFTYVDWEKVELMLEERGII